MNVQVASKCEVWFLLSKPSDSVSQQQIVSIESSSSNLGVVKGSEPDQSLVLMHVLTAAVTTDVPRVEVWSGPLSLSLPSASVLLFHPGAPPVRSPGLRLEVKCSLSSFKALRDGTEVVIPQTCALKRCCMQSWYHWFLNYSLLSSSL